MFPVRDNYHSKETPYVTYTLIALNVLLYLWDRNWRIMGPSVVFTDLTMRPHEVIDAVLHRGDPMALVTLFTSLFLHGSLLHLVGNMVFLLTFGDNVEAALGGPRFTLYYLFWGIAACVAQIAVMPQSLVPILGASGAIGGALGAYFLLFPSNRIQIIVFPFIFTPFTLAAWILLGLWFLWQILFPQEGVANWAHAGGFMAGMATILIMGGRQAVLRPVKEKFYYESTSD